MGIQPRGLEGGDSGGLRPGQWGRDPCATNERDLAENGKKLQIATEQRLNANKRQLYEKTNSHYKWKIIKKLKRNSRNLLIISKYLLIPLFL